MTRNSNRSARHNTLRIIGGQWRGRKLTFSPTAGLRPTTDRVRETLFNWLAPTLHDARCLDLFAGSGALGLEALSRGAASCVFVDTSAEAIRVITDHLQTLHATPQANCHTGSAMAFLQDAPQTFDIAFIDPPFGAGLVDPVCDLLEARGFLSPNSYIYVETGAKEPAPIVPAHWQLHREKTAGDVAYRLYTRIR